MPELFIVIGANGCRQDHLGLTQTAKTFRRTSTTPTRLASGLGSADEAQHQLAARGIVDRATRAAPAPAGVLRLRKHLLRALTPRHRAASEAARVPHIRRFPRHRAPRKSTSSACASACSGADTTCRQRKSLDAGAGPRENLIATWDAFDQVDLVDNSGQTAKLVATQPPGRIATRRAPAEMGFGHIVRSYTTGRRSSPRDHSSSPEGRPQPLARSRLGGGPARARHSAACA